MNIVIDSSIWLELITGGSKSKSVEKFFAHTYKIMLPVIVLYEVYKKIKLERNEAEAVLIVAQMERLSYKVIPIDHGIAIHAADLSLQYKIPMADAMIYASALANEATIISSDTHFKNLEAVNFIG